MSKKTIESIDELRSLLAEMLISQIYDKIMHSNDGVKGEERILRPVNNLHKRFLKDKENCSELELCIINKLIPPVEVLDIGNMHKFSFLTEYELLELCGDFCKGIAKTYVGINSTNRFKSVSIGGLAKGLLALSTGGLSEIISSLVDMSVGGVSLTQADATYAAMPYAEEVTALWGAGYRSITNNFNSIVLKKLGKGYFIK